MIPHELTEWITIMYRNKIKDNFGVVTETWMELVKVKSKPTNRRSYENKINEQLLAADVTVFKIRYRREVNETMIVVYYDKVYDIRQVEHLHRTDTTLTVERSKLSLADIAPEYFTLDFSSDEHGSTIPDGINTYQKGTIVPYVAVPDDGNAFESWLIDGVVSTLQMSYVQVVKNSVFVASFIKGAFTNVLHVFDTAPVQKGGWNYFGDYAKDNDVRVKNVRVGNFGTGVYINSNSLVYGKTPIKLDILINLTNFGSGNIIAGSYDGNPTQFGFALRFYNSNQLGFNIVDGSGTAQIIQNTESWILPNQWCRIKVDWNGLIGGLVTFDIDGIVKTETATKEWDGTYYPFRLNFSVGGAKYIYCFFDGHCDYILNHGQGSVIYDISGNGNNGTIMGVTTQLLPTDPDPEPQATLAEFWGSTSDEADAYDTLLGATLYELLGTTFGDEIIINGNFDTGTSGWILQAPYKWSAGRVHGNSTTNNYFFQTNLPVEAGKRYAFYISISALTRGEPFVSFVGAETFSRDLDQGLNVMTIVANHTGNITVYLYAGKAGVGGDCFFDNVSMREATTPSGEVGSIMPICANLMTDTFGTQLVINGDYSQAGVGNCVSIISSPIISNTNSQLVINAFVSDSAGGWEHTYAPESEVEVSFDVISITGNAWLVETTSDTRIALSVGRFKQRIVTGNLSVLINAFAILCKDGVIATLDNVSIKELISSVPLEIAGFKRLGYFPPASGILRGLPNKYQIPTDPQLNAYLPEGDYDYYELMDIPTSENIDMTKNDDTISLLRVHA